MKVSKLIKFFAYTGFIPAGLIISMVIGTQKDLPNGALTITITIIGAIYFALFFFALMYGFGNIVEHAEENKKELNDADYTPVNEQNEKQAERTGEFYYVGDKVVTTRTCFVENILVPKGQEGIVKRIKKNSVIVSVVMKDYDGEIEVPPDMIKK